MQIAELKQALRSRRKDYEHQATHFVVDGEAVCTCCVRRNFRDHLQTSGCNVECEEVNLENAKLFCALCQESIPAAYRTNGKR